MPSSLNWRRCGQQMDMRAEQETWRSKVGAEPTDEDIRAQRQLWAAEHLAMARAITEHPGATRYQLGRVKPILAWLEAHAGAPVQGRWYGALTGMCSDLGIATEPSAKPQPGAGRPDWMQDRRLLPKRPPGARTT